MEAQLVPMRFKFRPRSMRWALFEFMDIESNEHPGCVYLRRLRIIQTPWFGVYLHWIFLPDSDPAPHDHPWHFKTYVLSGGYTELFYPFLRRGKWKTFDLSGYNLKRSWGPGSSHDMGLGQAHQIIEVQPDTSTLVFVGKRKCEWGFYTDTGFIEWREYNATKKQLEGS